MVVHCNYNYIILTIYYFRTHNSNHSANGTIPSPLYKACDNDKPNNALSCLVKSVSTETGSFNLLYLLQVKFAFGLASVTHSNEPLDVLIMFTSVGETARNRERMSCVIAGTEKILMTVYQNNIEHPC